jgi:hypothetical protein
VNLQILLGFNEKHAHIIDIKLYSQTQLKYNLHIKKKNWLVNLALEAETAIK